MTDAALGEGTDAAPRPCDRVVELGAVKIEFRAANREAFAPTPGDYDLAVGQQRCCVLIATSIEAAGDNPTRIRRQRISGVVSELLMV
jgi:hypothetical protein